MFDEGNFSSSDRDSRTRSVGIAVRKLRLVSSIMICITIYIGNFDIVEQGLEHLFTRSASRASVCSVACIVNASKPPLCMGFRFIYTERTRSVVGVGASDVMPTSSMESINFIYLFIYQLHINIKTILAIKLIVEIRAIGGFQKMQISSPS